MINGNAHIDYLKCFYGKQAERWKDEHDDRRVFHNIYNALVDAYQELIDKDIQSPSIWAAFNNYRQKEEETLRAIMEYFKDRI